MIKPARSLVFGLSACLWIPAAGFCEDPAASLKAHLAAVAKPRPVSEPAALKTVEDYISRTLTSYGYPVELQDIAWAGATYHNVVAVKKGTGGPDAGVVLVTAHFDSVPGSPGADDNASSVAALLEVARLAAPGAYAKTVKFVAFNFEEEDGQGARRCLELARQSGERIEGVINMEMVGYRNKERGSQSLPAGAQNYRAQLAALAAQLKHPEIGAEMDRFLGTPQTQMAGDFLAAVANQDSLDLLSRFLKGARGGGVAKLVPLLSPDNGNLLPDTRRSDHAQFWDAGYPAILLTDTADLRNPNYHQATDMIDTLDLDFLRENIQAVFSGLAGVAGP